MIRGVVVGIDVGGTKTNATVLTDGGEFLIDRMIEVPSRVNEGPVRPPSRHRQAVVALALAAAGAAEFGDWRWVSTRPGRPAPVASSRSAGATNFAQRSGGGSTCGQRWRRRCTCPVIYNNDGNAAALYAHQQHFGADARTDRRSRPSSAPASVAASSRVVAVVRGSTGMAGELGHVHIPMARPARRTGQPIPRCNCGFEGDLESVASLSGIQNNLLPYWLTQYPEHPLVGQPRSRWRPRKCAATRSAATRWR
jgi:glucokinase